MKDKQTYRKVAIVVAIVGVILMAVMSIILNDNQSKRDPVILKFHEVMYALLSDEIPYHASEEIVHTDETGNITSKRNNEYYNAHTEFLSKQIYGEDDFFYELLYDGHYYGYSRKGDSHDVNKHEMTGGSFARPIISVSHNYFALDDKYISYVENENGYVFTCDNQTKVGTGYESNGNTISHLCDSAIAEVHLDKEWNLLQIVTVEEWTQVDEDGNEAESETKTTITFCDTSEKEIQGVLKKEYEFLEELLK